MPKFSKNCDNPFHDDWLDGIDGSSWMVNLRAFSLGELAEAFGKLCKFIANEKNISLENIKKVTHICKSCVKQCLKEEFYSAFVKTNIS